MQLSSGSFVINGCTEVVDAGTGGEGVGTALFNDIMPSMVATLEKFVVELKSSLRGMLLVALPMRKYVCIEPFPFTMICPRSTKR